MNQCAQRKLQIFLFVQVATRWRSGFLAMDDLQIGAAAKALQRVGGVHWCSQQNNRVTLVLEPLRGDVFRLLDNSDDRNSWGRINRAIGALIVKRAIAARHGSV